MKHTLLLFSFLLTTFALSAQYKDSLKTYRKLTKSYQKTSNFVFIPSGSYTRGMSDTHGWSPDLEQPYLQSQVMTIDSFFMEKFEVSNQHYLEFVQSKLREDSILGKTYLPDTLVWRSKESNNSAYVDYYFRHPAYSNYPVVGVSYHQAVAYAEWCTEKYNQNSDRVFKKVRFRLPTEEEWEYAYKGGLTNFSLPWGSASTFDHTGKPRANFRVISQLSVYRDSAVADYKGETKKRPVYLSNGMIWSNFGPGVNYSDVTAPVNALNPNGYGLYQMAGNVEEMVDAYSFREPKTASLSPDNLVKTDQPWGVSKGGSWNDTGFYLQYPVRQYYDDPNFSSREMGFRLVMEVLDY